MTVPVSISCWLEGENTRVVSLTPERTLADMKREVLSVCAQLSSRSALRIAIGGAESPYEFAVLLLGVLGAGKVPVLMSSDAASRHALRDTYDEICLSPHDEVAGLEDLPLLRADFEGQPASGASPMLNADQTIELFTSGSTGVPKRISKTLREMDEETHHIARHLSGVCAQTVLSTVDAHHQYGLTFSIWVAMSLGKALCTERIRYEEMLPAQGGYILVSTPTFLRSLTRIPVSAPALVVSAAGAFHPEDFERFKTVCASPVLDIYGSTETGVIASRLHSEAYNGVWTLIDGLSLEETSGQFLLHSPYAPDTLLEDRIEREGDHRFRLLGRMDRIAKVGEKRISLTEIEQQCLALLGLSVRALVVRPYGRDTIGVVVNLAESPAYEAGAHQRYRQALSGTLEPLALPRYWRSVPDWPRNSQGKIEIPVLERLFRCQAH